MKILVLAPHTDDESLGCGASIAKWREQGHRVHVVCFSTCYESLLPRHRGWGDTEPVITEVELADACDVLGCTFTVHEHKVRTFPEHRQSILDVLTYYKRKFMPDMVVGPSVNDVHQDHKTVAEEMVRCFWRTCSILSYELPWNSKGFEPNYFVEVNSAHMAKKEGAIWCYESQDAKDNDYMVAYMTQASLRGTECGKTLAEAFEVVRWLA